MGKRVRSPHRRPGQITGYLREPLAEEFDKLVDSTERAGVSDFVEAAVATYIELVKKHGLDHNLMPLMPKLQGQKSKSS